MRCEPSVAPGSHPRGSHLRRMANSGQGKRRGSEWMVSIFDCDRYRWVPLGPPQRRRFIVFNGPVHSTPATNVLVSQRGEALVRKRDFVRTSAYRAHRMVEHTTMTIATTMPPRTSAKRARREEAVARPPFELVQGCMIQGEYVVFEHRDPKSCTVEDIVDGEEWRPFSPLQVTACFAWVCLEGDDTHTVYLFNYDAKYCATGYGELMRNVSILEPAPSRVVPFIPCREH